MGDISKNFNRQEFRCRCGCGFNTVDVELLTLLEQIRYKFCSPIIITSGCRCKNHNQKIGGSKKSQHMLGKAADIKVINMPPQDIYNFIDNLYPNKYGFGLYSDWVHIDVRSEMARW